ncbi:MAG TPA: glycosyltransferase family A protein [Holophaga sp.]|nr:glycosyltransferase family A protein [Holophaga sp.]
MSERPLLSICIPTRGRADLLDLGLRNVLSEAEPFGSKVEVVVGDNASDDGTAGLLERYRGRIVTGRLETRALFPRSLAYTACDLARGEYVLFIGDDDLLVRGSVGRILAFLEGNPDLDYVYLNVGWVSIPQRNRAILEEDCRVPQDYETIFQLEDRQSRRLDRLEDLVALSWPSPYAMFSTIFCYLMRRSIYVERRNDIVVLEDWEDANQTLDNMFPHSVLSLGACAGKPVGCIGEPTVLQGSWHQDWALWINKTMIHGHALLFDWLGEKTPFDPAVLEVLWEELARYGARMVAQMLDMPERHKGMDVLRSFALPRLVRYPAFLETLREEVQTLAHSDLDAKRLEALVQRAARTLGDREPRIALWGLRGRGERWLYHCPHRVGQLAMIVDGGSAMQGRRTEFFDGTIQPPEVLRGLPFDILVLATREDITERLLPTLADRVPEGAWIVSVLGMHRVEAGVVRPAEPGDGR